MSALAQLIAAGSPQAALAARALGQEGRPVARAGLGDARPSARRAAVLSLEAIGDAHDLPAVVVLVADGDADVAAAATVAVRRLHAGSVGQGSVVLAAFDATASPELRVELALALGEGADIPIDTLRARHAKEKKPEVKRALSAAAARRGSEPHLRALADELRRGKGAAKREAIERAAYVHRSDMLPALLRLLDDETRLSPGWLEGLWVRVCDLAAWAIAEIVGGRFAAEDRGFTELERAALDEVRTRAEETLQKLS